MKKKVFLVLFIVFLIFTIIFGALSVLCLGSGFAMYKGSDLFWNDDSSDTQPANASSEPVHFDPNLSIEDETILSGSALRFTNDSIIELGKRDDGYYYALVGIWDNSLSKDNIVYVVVKHENDNLDDLLTYTPYSDSEHQHIYTTPVNSYTDDFSDLITEDVISEYPDFFESFDERSFPVLNKSDFDPEIILTDEPLPTESTQSVDPSFSSTLFALIALGALYEIGLGSMIISVGGFIITFVLLLLCLLFFILWKKSKP